MQARAGEEFTVLSGDWRNGLKKKRKRMKLNRKQSTVTRRTSYTNTGQGPAALERRSRSKAKLQVNHFMLLWAKSLVKAQTRARLRTTEMLFGTKKASGAAQTARPGSASCQEKSAGWMAPLPEGAMCQSNQRNQGWSAQRRKTRTTCSGFPARSIRSHLGIWEISR